jgi:hypothetical protein
MARSGTDATFSSSLFFAKRLDQWQAKGPTMFSDPIFLFGILACFVVLIILMIGIGGFAKGGEFNRKHSNRLMRYRIIAQAVAVIIIVGWSYLRSKG